MRSPLGSILNLVGTPDRSPVPYTSRRDSAAALGLMGRKQGGPSETALEEFGKSGTLFAIVGGLAEDVAGVEWKLWRTAASGRDEDRVEVTRHAALDLWRKPNPFMTGQEYREVQQQHMDLVGEAWAVQVTGAGFTTGPLALWPVMPHRMAPVPDARRFIAGYRYTDPDGQKIPLEVEDILFMRRPDPRDYYRGIGPVQAMMLDLGLATYSRLWNLNFFRNGAEPGGVVEMPAESDDDAYDEMVAHWREQHQGVSAAHRVAVLEAGAKWVERKITQRDMEFVNTLQLSDEQIRKAYRYPKGMLGSVDDVNRANAEAGRAMYAANLLVPRLERWKGLLNDDLLPLFGPTAEGLEFDYENPVEADAEAEDRGRDSKIAAVTAMVALGADPAEACEAYELPALEFAEPAPPPPALAPGQEPMPALPASTALLQQLISGWMGHGHEHAIEARSREARPRPRRRHALAQGDEEEHRADQLEVVQEDWERALGLLMGAFEAIAEDWRDELVEQIEDAVDAEDLQALAALGVDVDPLEEETIDALSDLTEQAAERMSDEAAEQDVLVDPVGGDMRTLSDLARAAAALIAAGYAVSAGREAIRLTHPGAEGSQIARQVRGFLEDLNNVAPRDLLGGTLTAAQNAGRIATLRAAPTAAYYANESLDANTCGPCREVDGKWLGNDLDAVEEVYPSGGYRSCLGRERCRGTVVAIWRPETTSSN